MNCCYCAPFNYDFSKLFEDDNVAEVNTSNVAETMDNAELQQDLQNIPTAGDMVRFPDMHFCKLLQCLTRLSMTGFPTVRQSLRLPPPKLACYHQGP